MNALSHFTCQQMVSNCSGTPPVKCGHSLSSTSICHQRKGKPSSNILICRYNASNFLSLGISPGPSQPKQIDTFLEPFLAELRLLEVGVPAYDALTDSTFLLKAHLILLSGDTPGISKLLHLSGHKAKYPCRACKIKGTRTQVNFEFGHGPRKGQKGQTTHYYYPLHPPRNSIVRRSRSAFANSIKELPLRTSDEYIRDGTISSRDQRLAINSGVKGVSPLTSLSTISIPQSAPFDVMHLVHLGLVRDVSAFLSGNYFMSSNLNDHCHGRMTGRQWVELGVDKSNIESPTSWGRNTRNIEKYIKGFKAEEFSNHLAHYLLPLVFNRVSMPTYKALQSLVLAISIATSYEVKYSEIAEIEDHITRFIKWYYDTYYQEDERRLAACKYTIHALIHVPQDIRNWGSASYFWQYPEVLAYDTFANCPGTTVWHSRQPSQKSCQWRRESIRLDASRSTFLVCWQIRDRCRCYAVH